MVNAEWPESEIRRIALRESEAICALQPSAVVCQGEFTLAYVVIRQLIGKGVTVLAACSNRVAEETMSPDGEILPSLSPLYISFAANALFPASCKNFTK